jgi:hypothetical protein
MIEFILGTKNVQNSVPLKPVHNLHHITIIDK